MRLLVDERGVYARVWEDGQPEPVDIGGVTPPYGGRGERWNTYDVNEAGLTPMVWRYVTMRMSGGADMTSVDSVSLIGAVSVLTRVGWAAGLVLSMGLMLQGCPWDVGEPGLDAAITAKNETDEVLTFRLFAEGEWVDLPSPRLASGQTEPVLSRASLFEPSTLTVDGCTEGDLVAVAPDGSEVARHAPPLCDGDHWVIRDE